MKRFSACLMIMFLLLSAGGKRIMAEDAYDYDLAYDVVFTADEKIEYRDKDGNVLSDYASQLPDMVPGDSLRLSFTLKNEYKKAIDWYMFNNSQAFETGSQDGPSDAAYDYDLTYTAKEGPLYSSDVVGGDEMSGIEEATDALKDYFLLHKSFGKSASETVTLVLSFDGETQINTYQEALANVQFRFAVEIPPDPEQREEQKIIYIPYTGDTGNMYLYMIMEVVSLILLGVVLYAYYRYLNRRKEAR